MEEENKGTELLAWGSAETDQFFISEDQFEAKKPVLQTYFVKHSLTIRDIACGGQHTLILTTTGKVFSMGSGDEGQLGREGPANVPGLVALEHPVDMISAGEAHSCAANSKNGILYTWGVMRNLGGNMAPVAKSPQRTGLRDFKGKQFKKLLSGNNHVIVLIDKKIHVWGDSETCVLGRIPLERRKNQQSLSVGGIALRGVIDIFTGGYHCFALVEKKGKTEGSLERQVYSWGKNNWGQLGIGTDESTHLQNRVLGLPDVPVKHISGGEDHTLFLLENGEVYGCGRNDDHQLGPILEEEVRKSLELLPVQPVKPQEDGEETGLKMDTITVPVKLHLAEPLSRVSSSSHYNIAVAQSGQFYSWGLGFSYVLGNGRDEELREPHAIKPEFFKNQKVASISLGGSHVMYTVGTEAFKQPDLEFTLDKIQQPRLPRVPFPHRIERDVSASIERKAKLKAKEAADKSSKSPSRKSDIKEDMN